MSDTRWVAAVIKKDIFMSDPCPLCTGKKFQCTECEDGHGVRHMWGQGKGESFFKKGTKVMVARRDSFFSEHDHNGIHKSIQYPEMYFVFEPYVSGKKLRVTTAYAIEHISTVRPFIDATERGNEALKEWQYQMSR